MKSKLTKKETAISILLFVLGTAALAGVMLAVSLINLDCTVGEFFAEEINSILTVGVSTFTLSAITYCYFYFEHRSLLAKYSKIVELFLMMTVTLAICYVVGVFIDQTARPLVLFAMLAAPVFKRRDAMFINTVFAILMFIFNRYCGKVGLEESIAGLLTLYCAGMLAIVLLRNIKTRIGCIAMGLILLIPVEIINVIMQLPFVEPATGVTLLNEALSIVGWAAFDCGLSVLLFFFFLPIFEALFAELTPFRLRELTSDNAKLMRKLKTNALGTYNHSIVVAQLVESCASAIGEDADLARAAAYYHDVGKLKNPEMFTENQSEYNLHTELSPELSVDIIRSHARDGAKLIKKYRLPEFFADVAIEHHGTLPIKYFYAKALKMSDGELNSVQYSYAGPTPSSKIAAIIMIADASEAAARSLSDRSPEKVLALVNSLIEERMNLGQFNNCDITMRDLSVITNTIVSQLTGVYHSRISYPKLDLAKKR